MARQSLLQGIFLTQGSSPGILYCRQILYYLSHQGSFISHISLLPILKLKVSIFFKFLNLHTLEIGESLFDHSRIQVCEMCMETSIILMDLRKDLYSEPFVSIHLTLCFLTSPALLPFISDLTSVFLQI